MSRRIETLLACAGFAVTLAAPALAQSPLASRSTHLPAPAASTQKRTVFDDTAAATAATAAPVTGTFTAKFTVKLVTAVPSGSEVLCVLSASTFDENTTTGTVNNVIEEEGTAKATVSGATATCTASIPYSWALSSASSDTVALSYQIYILNATAANDSGITRLSSQYVPGAASIKVPATGTTTTYTISATL